jgi:hypothetical protein
MRTTAGCGVGEVLVLAAAFLAAPGTVLAGDETRGQVFTRAFFPDLQPSVKT